MEQKPSSYQKLKDRFSGIETQLLKLENEAKSSTKKVKGGAKPISGSIPIVQTLYRIRTDISTWRSAIQYAEQIQYPVRLELYRLYAEIMLDAHLSSTIDVRKSFTQSANYIVTKNGVEMPELTEKLKAKWFSDFINLALDSIYFGFSLIEFNDMNSFGEFSSLDLVPRQYVRPEFSLVTPTPSSLDGQSFLDQPWSNWCIGVGEKTNLGLLAKAAPLVLWKRTAQMAYAEYGEIFGTPLRVLKTDSFDEETRQAGENFMRNMATSAYAVIGKEDDVQIISDRQAAGVEQMFNGLITTMNQEISKLIMGGTASLDAKSFVGSAKIHQENFELIAHKDRVMLENIFKYQLVPLLNIHGFGFEGCKIETDAADDLTLQEQFAIDKDLLAAGYVIDAEYLNEKYGTKVANPTALSINSETSETQE